jgi:uncharacterized phage protein gp47/JayE
MAYGITAQGFVKKTYEVILAEMQAELRKAPPDGLGSNVDLSSASPIGVMVMVEAGKHAEQWDLQESAYYANQIDNATGVSLDRATRLRNITRTPAIQSLVTLTFTGVDTTVIPSGTICQTQQGIQFATSEAGVISGTTGDVQARAIIAGESGNVPAGSITVISTPVAGISAVTNAEDSLNGKGVETDAELRARYKSVTGDAGASAPLIQQAFNDVDSIISATVIENNSDDTVGDLTPHSIKAVIEGGTDAEILTVFLKYKLSGIETIGAESVSGLDGNGILRSYKYDRPVNKDIYITANITIDTASISVANWTATYEADALESLIRYVGGSYNSITYAGLDTGADVEGHLVAGALADVPFIIGEIDIDLGFTASPTESRLIMDLSERARADETRIVINAS